MRKFLRSFYFSFPVQLVLLHLKKHLLILLIWFLLFAIVSNLFGKVFGLSYLFLDPEYLGKVNFWSFFIVGLMLGLFIMAFHISSYILNSFRFPFLATLNYPLSVFTINNSVIPIIFLITYLVLLIKFQYESEFALTIHTFINVLSLLAGLAAMVIIFSLYFLKTNKNIFVIIGLKKRKGEKVRESHAQKKRFLWEQVQQKARLWPIDNYLTAKLRLRPVRGVEHYDEKLLVTVFKQHHYNALIIMLLSIALLITLGALADFPGFIIPAGASILILFTIIIMMISAFAYWTRGWQMMAFLIFVILISVLFRFDKFNYKSKAYGLDYDIQPEPYNMDKLAAASSADKIREDINYTIQLLENWKAKQTSQKPRMIFVNATGGGHRGSLWAFNVLQQLDSLYPTQFMPQAFMMSGASGGMLASAYYRELYLLKLEGKLRDIQDEKYRENIGKDLLNPVSFMIVSNDIFYPWRNFKVGDNKYQKDRGYFFEKYYNINTDFILEKPVMAYRKPEFEMKIPMLVLSPTIISDERIMFISAQPVSYLTRPAYDTSQIVSPYVDGVDFMHFFRNQGSENINMTTALRLNATYPYVLPPVTLPSHPSIQVMDAGIRDNYGIEATIRFIFTFREWIKENTSGVVIVSINSANAAFLKDDEDKSSLFTRLFNPIGNIYMNWTEMQGYNQKYLMEYAKGYLDGKVDFVEFNYIPGKKEQVASMSFHLTTKEKRNIINAINLPINQDAVQKLDELLK